MTRDDRPEEDRPTESVGTQEQDTAGHRQTAGSDGSTVNGPRPVKRRRRTNAELEVIDDALVAAVAEEHPVTVRGAYYRLVSIGVVDKTEAGYDLVQRELLKLRRSGRVPYWWVTDGTRWVRQPRTYTSLDDMLTEAASTYRRDIWSTSVDAVWMFSEKDAISGVIWPITEAWDVPLGVLRGYTSESFAHRIAEQIRHAAEVRMHIGGTVNLYQLGDHDPSGVDLWRDFGKRMSGFIGDPEIVAHVNFERIAVTPEQIEDLGLMTRPTKKSDTRSRGFKGESVEVDAIPAATMRQIVEDAITRHVDQDRLRILKVAEESERTLLYRMAGEVAS